MAKSQKVALPAKTDKPGAEKGKNDPLAVGYLQNQFLIAMPSLAGPYFNKSVTYICEHNEEGAMGLIINLPINISLSDLLKQIEADDGDKQQNPSDLLDNSELTDEHTPIDKDNADIAGGNSRDNRLEQLVLSGGPLAQQRGFVLHSSQKGWASSLVLSDEIMITTSKDILQALGTNKAPENFIVTLGYAGWEAGQLEQELQENSWLTIPADSNILFNTPIELRWKKAAESLGINLAHLSADIGHA